jgi:hypothetical protein
MNAKKKVNREWTCLLPQPRDYGAAGYELARSVERSRGARLACKADGKQGTS